MSYKKRREELERRVGNTCDYDKEVTSSKHVTSIIGETISPILEEGGEDPLYFLYK